MKKKLGKLLGVLALASLLAILGIHVAQSQNAGGLQVPNESPAHRVGGFYYAPAYATWQAPVLNTLTGTGAQTYIVGPPSVLRDGTNFAYNMGVMFNTSTPVTFADANSEVVTPTTVSIGPCPTSVTTGGPSGVALCANITATFANTHGQGSRVTTGTNGAYEAITDAGNNGGGQVYFQNDTGIVTLATGSTTTTSTALVPAAYEQGAASCRVTTTITTAANYSLGIAGATTSFVNTSTNLTAGNIQTMAFLNAGGTKTGTTIPGTATALVFTTNVNPGAGALKCRVWGIVPVQASN